MNVHSDNYDYCIDTLKKAVQHLVQHNPIPSDIDRTIDSRRVEDVIMETAEKLKDNYPYHHPGYIGQMLKPPHPVAYIAYALSMIVNPNNHALDGGRASTRLEKELIKDHLHFYGFKDGIGHLTSSGTIANLEALFIARCLNPGGVIAYNDQAHYTHKRMCHLLGIESITVRTDAHGRMDLDHLETVLQNHEVGTVVCTAGTTGLGVVDPIPEIITLCKHKGVRVHVDAAYGGYFKNCNLSRNTLQKYDAIQYADSFVVDPHKHGMQPYGCGMILFKDQNVTRFYLHDSPYTYYTSEELHLGEISIECSRAGSAAVALHSTMLYFEFNNNGFSAPINDGIDAAKAFKNYISASNDFVLINDLELDIVVFSLLGDSISEISQKNRRFFDLAAKQGFHLSLLKLEKNKLHNLLKHNVLGDSEVITVLRSVFMKPEHLEYLPKIRAICNSIKDL